MEGERVPTIPAYLSSSIFGMNVALRNKKTFTVRVVRSSAIIPVEDIAAMAFTLQPLVPRREFPYFQIASLVAEPVSSTQTNISCLYKKVLAIKAPLKLSHL